MRRKQLETGDLVIQEITRQNIDEVPNAVFRKYAQQYVDIYESYMQAIGQFGLQVATDDPDVRWGRLGKRIDELQARGLDVSVNRASFCTGWKSPSCVACRLGLGTETFMTSTQCPRNCYFCFNPNQGDYEYYQTHVKDIAAELEQRYRMGAKYNHVGITGGEPLLHLDTVLTFLNKARELYPDARTRLYTSGSGLDQGVLGQLMDAGLQEIRFSIKLEDKQALIEATIDKICMCSDAGLCTMVEMPVMPNQVEQMKELLQRLEGHIDGINLLELCFPFNNAEAFAERGYKIKSVPYRAIYDYWYAGGLPVSGSEEACIDLLEFALDRQLKMGVHYCSLENKVTGQLYQQNYASRKKYPLHALSEKDCFLKSGKVFGNDINRVEQALKKAGVRGAVRNKDYGFLEFPLTAMRVLAVQLPKVPVAVSNCVVEYREDGPVLREVKVDLAYPETFDFSSDV